MTKTNFQLKIENTDSHLSLADLSAKEVAQFISAIADIIEAAAPKAEDGEGPGVSLAAVSEKSILVGQRLSVRCQGAAATILAAISTGDFSRMPCLAHNKLVEFSRQIISQGRVANLSGAGMPEVEISSSHPIPEIKPRQMKHMTTLYGKVVSAGGIRSQRATLILSKTGHQFDIQVGSVELVKQLAARLYEVVGIKGLAWTDLRTGEMVSFRAESLTRFRGSNADPMAALKKIAADFPEAWVGVDVPALISEMRDGEE